ncbi:MAG: serine/threonine-protein kinase [Myxococcota bacterium]
MQRGQRIAGRYEVEGALGNGGVARLMIARDLREDRHVVLKSLQPAHLGDALVVRRFAREAAILALAPIPHVPRLLAAHEDVLVLEYVSGTTLADVLLEGSLETSRAVAIATQLLEALEALHGAGAVHRDIKPDNVIVDGDRATLIDFGIAAFLDGRDECTPVGVSMTTLAFATPEQLTGSHGRDPRVDVYAVGMLLFLMLAGEMPYRATAPAELARCIQDEPVPPLRAFRRDPPTHLEGIVRRALAKDPSHRWKSALAMRRALLAFPG